MAKQYWAQIIELDEEMTPATIPGATDHEDAADSLVATRTKRPTSVFGGRTIPGQQHTPHIR